MSQRAGATDYGEPAQHFLRTGKRICRANGWLTPRDLSRGRGPNATQRTEGTSSPFTFLAWVVFVPFFFWPFRHSVRASGMPGSGRFNRGAQFPVIPVLPRPAHRVVPQLAAMRIAPAGHGFPGHGTGQVTQQPL